MNESPADASRTGQCVPLRVGVSSSGSGFSQFASLTPASSWRTPPCYHLPPDDCPLHLGPADGR